MIDFNLNHIEIVIIDTNPALDFESDQNRRLNLQAEFELKTTNGFGDPNHLSLVTIRFYCVTMVWWSLHLLVNREVYNSNPTLGKILLALFHYLLFLQGSTSVMAKTMAPKTATAFQRDKHLTTYIFLCQF